MIPEMSDHSLYQKAIFSVLSGIVTPRLIGLDSQFKVIYGLLSDLFTSKQSSSLLLLGNRGTGKTATVNAALSLLRSQFALNGQHFFVVRLNGALHDDDRSSLHSIIRQLEVEQKSQDFTGHSTSDALTYILEQLRYGTRKSAPLIFVIEEFDCFASCHAKQTLLYNLFDASRNNANPVCVLCISARMDALELLEKRVKSRFCHRQLFFHGVDNVDQYSEIAKNALLNIQDLPIILRKHYTEIVEEMFDDKDILDVLKNMYDKSRDIRTLYHFLSGVIFSMSDDSDDDSEILSADRFINHSKAIGREHYADIVNGLTIVEASLLVAAKCLVSTAERDDLEFNFSMLCSEYKKIIGHENSETLTTFPRNILWKSFFRLIDQNLLKWVEKGGMKTNPDYRLCVLNIPLYILCDAMSLKKNCPPSFRKWLKYSHVSKSHYY